MAESQMGWSENDGGSIHKGFKVAGFQFQTS